MKPLPINSYGNILANYITDYKTAANMNCVKKQVKANLLPDNSESTAVNLKRS